MSYGTVTNFEDSATVRFERQLAAPIDSVWRAITDEQSLGLWLAPSRFEPKVGGTVQIDFGDGEFANGIISVFEPPHTLEYTWIFTGEPDSTLRFDLSPTAAGTSLVLEHRLLPANQAPGYGAGWHAHLDMLGCRVEETQMIDWDARFNEVLGTYVGA